MPVFRNKISQLIVSEMGQKKTIVERIVVLVLFSLFIGSLSGCFSTRHGNRNVEDVGRYMQLQQGKSTKADVYKNFGQPHEVVYQENVNESCFWQYYSSSMEMSGVSYIPLVGLIFGGSNVVGNTSTFYFDSDSKFVRVETQSVSKYVNTWVGLAKAINERSTETRTDRVKDEMNKTGLSFSQSTADRVKDIKHQSDD